ncbi:OLC1v1001646C1 [Oldenlandia corymbosa var. corymbosa]|uniref:OLC1v1001646C1 n=1 Tax=Oldenlandia corymbosa var. corymbosa TaxID=529605 RepID=A0AAV1D820_OLDCO|nr:OLC1v1001646C1 [Oldenlandia corymbosa var. corymbosa]
MQNYINMNWALYARVQHCDRNFFVTRFLCKTDLLAVLDNGPYAVHGGLLILSRWYADDEIVLDRVRITKLSMWVRLHKAPLLNYNWRGARELASMLGEVEKVKEDSTSLKKATYIQAKIWVEPANPLIPAFYAVSTRGTHNLIECRYEKLHKFCRRCGRLGHPHHKCPIVSDVALDAFLNDYFRAEAERNHAPMHRNELREMFLEMINYYALIEEERIRDGFHITMDGEQGFQPMNVDVPPGDDSDDGDNDDGDAGEDDGGDDYYHNENLDNGGQEDMDIGPSNAILGDSDSQIGETGLYDQEFTAQEVRDHNTLEVVSYVTSPGDSSSSGNHGVRNMEGAAMTLANIATHLSLDRKLFQMKGKDDSHSSGPRTELNHSHTQRFERKGKSFQEKKYGRMHLASLKQTQKHLSMHTPHERHKTLDRLSRWKRAHGADQKSVNNNGNHDHKTQRQDGKRSREEDQSEAQYQKRRILEEEDRKQTSIMISNLTIAFGDQVTVHDQLQGLAVVDLKQPPQEV